MSDPKTPQDGSPEINAGGRISGGQGRGRSGGGQRRSNGPAAQGQIEPRRTRYMLATPQAPGVQPMSANDLMAALQDRPDIEIVKKIDPPRVLGLQGIGAPPMPGVVVANIEPARAEALRELGQGRLVIEPDAPLSFMLEPTPTFSTPPNPGVFVPSSAGFSARFEVTGPNGPLADADVHLYGSLFPVQGKTDANGNVTLNVIGEDPESMRALYVKPRADHWDFWLRDPKISAGSVNSVRLKPIELPRSREREAPWFGWGQKAMGLDRLPDRFDGTGVRIAVIDSGAAQQTHRNLRNFGPGRSIIGDDPDAWTDDQIGHGSHCGGVIGGMIPDDSDGIRGFAPGAEIHVCRVFPGGRFSDLIAALDYCMENEIDIASMSLGGGSGSQILADRIQRAKALGTACIVAAGNSAGPVQFPAFLGSTLSVSAIGKFGEFPMDSFHSQQILQGFQGREGFFPASFSCFGPEIDVCAPGVAIISAMPTDGFAAWDGTSMATPHVAGLAALMLAHHPDFQGPFSARNGARVDRLFDIIRASCQPLPFGQNRVGRGMPWAPAALGLEALPFGGSSMNALSGADGIPPESIIALRKLIQMLG